MARRIKREHEKDPAELKKQEPSGEQRKEGRKKAFAGPLLLLLLAAFFLFAWYSTRSDGESFFKRVDQVKGDREPFLILLLESSTSIGEDSMGEMEKLAREAEGILEVFKVEYNPQDPSREAIYFIDNYGIESLPAAILVDSQGEVFRRYAAPVSHDEVLEDARGLADDES